MSFWWSSLHSSPFIICFIIAIALFLFVNTHGYNLFLNDGGMSMASAAWGIVLFAPESIMSFGFESVWFGRGPMFCFSPRHPFAPHLEGGVLHVGSHQSNHLLFWCAELVLDGFEGGSVLPGHFDDPVQILGLHVFQPKSKSFCCSSGFPMTTACFLSSPGELGLPHT